MALGYLISPAFQCVNENGKPLVGGTLRVVLHGTTIPYITYRDFDGNLNHEYVPLDAKGMAVIIADDSTVYDVYCYDLNRVQQWSRLNVSVGGGEGGGGSGEYSAGDGIAIENNEISAKVDGTTITVNEDGELEAHAATEYTSGDGIDIYDGKVSVTKPVQDFWTFEDTAVFRGNGGGYEGHNNGQWGYMGVGPLHYENGYFDLSISSGRILNGGPGGYLAWNVDNGSLWHVLFYDPTDTTKYAECSEEFHADFYHDTLVGLGKDPTTATRRTDWQHLIPGDLTKWTPSQAVGTLTLDMLKEWACCIYFPGTTGTSPAGTDFAAVTTNLFLQDGSKGELGFSDSRTAIKLDIDYTLTTKYNTLAVTNPMPAPGSSLPGNVLTVTSGGSCGWRPPAGAEYTAGPGISITNSAISGDFVNQPPAGAHSSSTFPQVSDSVYTITQDDLTNGWINLRLADIRPADAVTANVGVTFQVFLNNIHWARENPQTQITPGDSFTCSIEFSIADKTTPNSWVSSTYVSNITWTWGSQTMTDKKAVAFAGGPASADFVDTFPQLSIYLPTELRNVLAVGDELHLEGYIFAIPAKYRLSLV